MDTIAEIKQRMSITSLLNTLGIDMEKGFVHSIYKEDKTPSMKIFEDENRYWCFATNNGGDVINLYQDFYRLETGEAIKQLAQLCGIDNQNSEFRIQNTERPKFSEEIGRLNRQREDLFKCLSEDERYVYDETCGRSGYADENEAHIASLKAVRASRLYTNRQIFNHLYNYCNKYKSKEIYAYLTNTRKLPESTIEKFKLFSIDNVFQVSNHLKKSFSMQDLKRSGLFNAKGNFIFYNHRLIIPYLFKDQLIYLRGRFFDQQNNYESEGFKYLGLVNDKVDLNRTKRFFNQDVIRTLFKGERLYLVEGEFDAMAIDAMNRNAIAVPGASNTPKDKYFIPLLDLDVVLCMDNDGAGNGLKDRLLQIFRNFDKVPSIKKLPVKDANEFLISA